MFVKKIFAQTTAVVALFAATTAHAYIPTSQTILSRLARNDGKGVYSIEQEVVFRTETEPLVVHEHWLVENGESMRLTVTPVKGSQDTWKFETVYMDGKKYFRNADGRLMSQVYGHEFIEAFWHFRSARSLLDALLKHHLVPAHFGREHKIGKLENYHYTPDPDINLVRSNGVVSWFLGEPTPASAEKANPGIWIEQDAFLLRRLRLPSQAEVTADRFVPTSGGLKFPHERTVTWDTNSVSIRTISVKGAHESSAKQLDPNKIGLGEKSVLRLPEVPQMKEFYSRFR